MKFGGTSMGSADRIAVAARLTAEQRAKRPVVVVVSAMSKVTDLLLDSLRKAEAGDQADLDANLEKLSAKHREACCGLLSEDLQKDAIAGLDALIGEFARIAKGVMMLGERPPRSVDEAVAVGERLSAYLMALYMESEGMPAVAVNAAEVIATDAVFGNATPLMEPTRARAAAVLGPLLEGQPQRSVPIVTGFNGSTLDKR